MLVNFPRVLETRVVVVWRPALQASVGTNWSPAFCIITSPLWPWSQDSPSLLVNPWPFPWAWGSGRGHITKEGRGETEAIFWSKFVQETKCQVVSNLGERVKCRAKAGWGKPECGQGLPWPVFHVSAPTRTWHGTGAP